MLFGTDIIYDDMNVPTGMQAQCLYQPGEIPLGGAGELLAGMTQWMEEREYESVVQMRGMARRMNPALKDREPKIEDAHIEPRTVAGFLIHAVVEIIVQQPEPSENRELVHEPWL